MNLFQRLNSRVLHHRPVKDRPFNKKATDNFEAFKRKYPNAELHEFVPGRGLLSCLAITDISNPPKYVAKLFRVYFFAEGEFSVAKSVLIYDQRSPLITIAEFDISTEHSNKETGAKFLIHILNEAVGAGRNVLSSLSLADKDIVRNKKLFELYKFSKQEESNQLKFFLDIEFYKVHCLTHWLNQG